VHVLGSAHDAAGNIVNTGSFNSYSQAPPQAEIDRNTTLFRTSDCTHGRTKTDRRGYSNVGCVSGGTA
jgi:hypothetical protein